MPAFAIAARFLCGVLSPFFGTSCTTTCTSAPASDATLSAVSTGSKSNSYIAARSWKRLSTAWPMKPTIASSSPRESHLYASSFGTFDGACVAEALLVGARGDDAAVEEDAVPAVVRILGPDLDARRRAGGRLRRRAVHRRDGVAVDVRRLRRVVAPLERLHRVPPRRVTRALALVVDGEEQRVVEEVALAPGVVDALDREAEQPVEQFRREVDAEQDGVRAGDRANGDRAVGASLAHPAPTLRPRGAGCGAAGEGPWSSRWVGTAQAVRSGGRSCANALVWKCVPCGGAIGDVNRGRDADRAESAGWSAARRGVDRHGLERARAHERPGRADRPGRHARRCLGPVPRRARCAPGGRRTGERRLGERDRYLGRLGVGERDERRGDRAGRRAHHAPGRRLDHGDGQHRLVEVDGAGEPATTSSTRPAARWRTRCWASTPARASPRSPR